MKGVSILLVFAPVRPSEDCFQFKAEIISYVVSDRAPAYTSYMPFITTEHLKIYFEEQGDGPPVLFISGTDGDLRQRPNVLNGPLPKHRRVIAFDQRGLGQTEKPDRPYTMKEYGEDAAALLKALGIRQADVIGVSFGGMVAQHFAIQHQSMIRKLVLCCTSPGGEMPSYPLQLLPEDLTLEERFLKLLGISDTRRDHKWQANNPEHLKAMIAGVSQASIPDHHSSASRMGARRQLEARSHHDVNDDLSSINLPTMICAGRHDGIAPAANQHHMVSLISDAVLKWYEGGHTFMIQDKNAWIDIIAFLNAPDS